MTMEQCASSSEPHNLLDHHLINDEDVEAHTGYGVGCDRGEETYLRNQLKFFFMNPVEKWDTKKRFPYKFLIQVVKIVLITMQLCIFADSRSKHVYYIWDNRLTFSHLFLKDWDSTREVKAYPPDTGAFAVYLKKDFNDTLNYAVSGYWNLSNALGPYSYFYDQEGRPLPIEMCVEKFRHLEPTLDPSYDNRVDFVVKCYNITEPYNGTWVDIDFQNLKRVVLKMLIKSTKYKMRQMECFGFEVSVILDNSEMAGQALLSLDANSYYVSCADGDMNVVAAVISTNSLSEKMVNYVVISLCFVSCVLCIRSILRAQSLKRRTVRYFKVMKNKDLNLECRMQFLNFWYIMIVVNDVCIIVGTYLQDELTRNQYTDDKWNVCSLLLGTGNMLVWFGVLRYFGFFKIYNVVILTLKSSFPAVLRFLFCAIIIYAGFVFCGWLVFGPFHMKFRSLSMTSECLFSLINGDDMFATFNILETKSSLLFVYSRVYIYGFTSLFIYVILSLFISIIMDSYETIKRYYEEGFPKTEVQTFMDESPPAGIEEDDELPTSLESANSNRRHEGFTFRRFFLSLSTCR